MGYKGQSVGDFDETKDIPFEFAHFIACENPDSMSPNLTGAFYLYVSSEWVMEDSTDINVLLKRFKKAAETEDSINDSDVQAAEKWVKGFLELYGVSALFYFSD